jgi:hypothetical protein
MTWSTFHRRGEVLRTVMKTVDVRRDGLLPMDVPGVLERFGDELTLLGALALRWHTRLSGHLERALADQPADADEAAVTAWVRTAEELPGTRLVLDHCRDQPHDDRMARMLATATAKERTLLAAAVGRAGHTREATTAAGRALEQRARARQAGAVPV